ncbi:MAG TPA: hypothetical protein VK668_19460 [Mucilaginibacter sp.]|nr:hypothetical protein [Mucilaginibacter sp.]
MEEKNEYPAEFYLSDRELKISGPVEFVKEQMQFTKNVIDLFAERIKHKLIDNKEEGSKSLSFKSETLDVKSKVKGEEYVEFEEVKDIEFIAKYSEIIAVDGDKIQVLCKIPGSSLGSRMVSLVVIYLFIKLKTKSVERVSFSELRNICEIHGELDSGHFSEYLKKNKKWFLLDGNSKNSNAKITIPGMREAERLLDSMKN